MAKKIKYNSSASRWELLDDTTVLAFMAGDASADPWTLNGGVWPYADGSGNTYTLTAGGTVDGNITSGDILEGKVGYARGKRITGSITVNPEVSVDGNQVSIPEGYHEEKVVTVNGISQGVYGYLNADGNFQAIDLTSDTPQNSGDPETIDGDVYLYATGVSEPDYYVEAEVNITGNIVTISSGYVPYDRDITVGTPLDATTYTPGVSDQTIQAGVYTKGVQTIKGDANLVASNIAKDVTIFGITGTHEGGVAIDPEDLNLIDQGVVLAGYSFAGRTEDGTVEVFQGSLANNGVLTITPSNSAQTFDGGYYEGIDVSPAPKTGSEFTVDGAYTNPLYYISEYASLDGTPGSLIDRRFSSDERLGTITDLNPLLVAESGAMIIGEHNYVNVDSTNIEPGNIKEGVTILGVTGELKAGDSFEMLGGIDDPSYYISEKASLNGERGYLVDFRFRNDTIKTINTVSEAEYIYPADVTSIIGESNYIHIPDITKITPEVLKKGVTVLGVNGEYEGENISFDFSAASVFDSTAVLKDTKAYNGNGDLVEGSIDLTNLEPYSIKRGVTINGVTGKYTSVSSNAATAADILPDKIAFVNGTKLTGTMPTSTPVMEGNTVTVPRGYVADDMTFDVETPAGGMEFYECVSTSGGGQGIQITGSDGWDGSYMLVDPSAAGDARVFQSADGKSIQYEDMGIMGYRWSIIGNDYCYSSDDPDATIETICSEFEFDSGNPTVEPYSSGGASSWSGYKMVWSEGSAGNDIIVTGSTEYLNGVYTKYGSGWLKQNPNDIEGTGIVIEYTTENPYGDITTGWIMYNNGNGDSYYGNTTAGSGATIEEICAGPWVSDWAGSGPIPTFTPSGSPAGWVRAEGEPVDGLEIKGYTPVSGKFYSADTTINGNMYPAEIHSEGENSDGDSGNVPGIKITGSDGQDGVYLLVEPNSTGDARVFQSDNGYSIQYEDMGIGYRWALVKTGTYDYYGTSSSDANADIPTICSELSFDAYYDVQPTVEPYGGGGDGGPTGGDSKPAPGSANVVLVIGMSDYNDDEDAMYMSPKAFFSLTPTLSGHSREWTTSADYDLRIKWSSSLGKWVMDDSNWGDYRFIGDSSDDPWDCTWYAPNDQDRPVFIKAISL